MRFAVVLACIMFAHTVSAAVVINEVAWMGTTDSASNEWIELANTGSVSTDLTGWILRIEGKKDISLGGAIAANGYYLIERTDDSTVPSVPADLVASFSTGLSNSGATLSLLDASGSTVDRVDGSNEWNISGEVAGDNTTKEPASRTSSGWVTLPATPRAQNSGTTASSAAPQGNTSPSPVESSQSASSLLASFPIDPQIFADAGPSSRTVLAGAPTTFSGTVWGLKKEPIDTARMVWGFGDGGTAEGKSVIHTFYYPGDYTVILDASSGYYAASDRVYVTAIAPRFVLRTGGDTTRSFTAIENQTSSELDLSGWQISANGKVFVFPKNTFLGSRKTLTLPSEITGLLTPSGATPQLLFPNGFPVVMGGEETTVALVAAPYSVSSHTEVLQQASVKSSSQKASAHESLADSSGITLGIPESEKSDMWGWYTGAALIGAFGLLAVRSLRRSNENASENDDDSLSAEDFEILEE